ncbi:hypothetical protein Pr1d_53590 [Bythopirellula goksoeyrii]|uniref:Uncharacterized protein n=1 Tax=Bythopirellula goksoeyrii TaxID=1400387 RepID=A0A5B9QVH0_9BACT|nr:hypothetical protein Pr1d_53590 [Bythopirellula goksoeyrii]
MTSQSTILSLYVGDSARALQLRPLGLGNMVVLPNSNLEVGQVLFQKPVCEPTSDPRKLTCTRSGAPDFAQFEDGPTERSCINRGGKGDRQTARGILAASRPLNLGRQVNLLRFTQVNGEPKQL